MENIKITLKNGKEKTFNKKLSYYEISKEFGYGKEVLAAKVNNEVFALCESPKEDVTVEFIDLCDVTGNKIYRSGLQFIFEVALKEVFPELEVTYQHSVPKGILGEIIGDKIITQEDLTKIKSKMAEIINGETLKGSIDILSLEKMEKICEQMKTSICKIYGDNIGTGFFCKILYDDEYIPVLITNYHILSNEFIDTKKQLKISINNDKVIDIININENSKIYFSQFEQYDIMILKIEENYKYHYLELDYNLLEENEENIYKDKSIYILHYPEGNNISVSFGCGITKSKDKYYITHLCNTGPYSSGSPILNLLTNKVIGIHTGIFMNIDFDNGVLLKYPLSEINNQIKLEIKINKEDINKKVYFLDNTKEHNYLKELNVSNTELYIDNKKCEFKKYFIPDKEGIYEIKIKLKCTIKDCSYLFGYCRNIINIDLSLFITKDLNKMSGMLVGCDNLKNICLPKFDDKKKSLFVSNNNEFLIKFNNNMSHGNTKEPSKKKEIILSLILNDFFQKIRTIKKLKQKQKNILNKKFNNLVKNIIKPLLFNDNLENDLNLISIIDIFLGNQDICSEFLISPNDNDSILNIENYKE